MRLLNKYKWNSKLKRYYKSQRNVVQVNTECSRVLKNKTFKATHSKFNDITDVILITETFILLLLIIFIFIGIIYLNTPNFETRPMFSPK